MCQDALLVIDLQNDFLPGGALAVPGGDRVIDPIRGLMTLPNWRAVVLTQDWHPADHVSFASSHPGRKPFESIALSYGRQTLWPDHCVAGSQGAAFPPDFDTSPARLILRKGMNAALDSYSAFIEADGKTPTGLDGFLKNLNIHRVSSAGSLSITASSLVCLTHFKPVMKPLSFRMPAQPLLSGRKPTS